MAKNRDLSGMGKEDLRMLAASLVGEFVDKQRLIDAGFAGFAAAWAPGADTEKRHELRVAFFGGAMHLLNSIRAIGCGDHTQGADDVGKCLESVHHELDRYRTYLNRALQGRMQ